jgi:hypothetical protein
MNRSRTFTGFATCAAIAVAAGALGFASGRQAQPERDADAQPEFPLPPGWTQEDMMACMEAGTPGEQHQILQDKFVGNWTGTAKMWMAPGMEPTNIETTMKTTTVLDGRFIHTKATGDSPFGPFTGVGYAGYDNLKGQYVSSWVSNHGTGIMNGVGKLSDGGAKFTWTYDHMCPINKKPVTMREVYHFNGDSSMTIEMFGPDPKTGKEFKSMHFELNKRG